MKIVKTTCAALFFAVCGTLTSLAEIVTYPVPQALYYAFHNDDYTVKVRQVGGKEWIDLYEYSVKVDMDTNSDATLVQFDFSGRIEIKIQKNNGELRSAVIRPLSKGIVPHVEGDVITFEIDCPQKLSIEFNNDRLHNLHLFANALEKDIPREGDKDVMFFGTGVHEPKKGKSFKVPSNTTVYLAPGAVLKAPLNCDNTENVKIRGRGMVYQGANGISAHYTKNLTVEDITVVNPRYNTMTAAVSRNVTVRNLKSFSHQGWGDGLDIYCCEDVLAEDLFLRNSDDCIAVYAHRWDFYGDVRNITVRNSTLWSDIAHVINIGTHGNTQTEGEVLENMRFENLDILEHDEDDPDYQGAMSINTGDHNLVRNVLFDNIRVERIQEGQLFHLRVMYLPRYCTGPGRGIHDITFRNIYYTGKNENPSVIQGYDAQRMVDNIAFENIVINGKKAATLEDLNIKKGNFVGKISIK